MNSTSDPSPQQIAALVLERYPENVLMEQFKSFEWDKKGFEEAVLERSKNERQLQQAIWADDDAKIKESILRIHKWGFGRETPNSQEEWLKDTIQAVREFTKSEPDVLQQKAVLNMLLSHKGIKLATASKWICFCDQSRYAIYDSRVSIALRDVVGSNQQRLFPTVARRKINGVQFPYGDTMKPSRLVEKYFLYLDTLRIVSGRTGLKVAEIEMALFMIGK